MNKDDEELVIIFAFGKYDNNNGFRFHEPYTCMPLKKFKELLFKDFKEWLDEES